MIGASDLGDFFKRLESKEKNHDAKRHIGYALAREGKPLDPSVSKLLSNYDVKTIDSARLGEQAPDFELPSLGGKQVKLSDYRGQSAVVLVFVYGDT
ncbi:MAG: redoxin domain-containing protein [Planctomycetia bacterium]|nr:redoxin domain-containing protein [Planctomycetia bacterium]